MKYRKTVGKILVAALIVLSWLTWDLLQAHRDTRQYPSYRLVSEFPETTPNPTTVAIVRSDDSTFTNPVPTDDADISYSTIEEMVRKAVNLAGGFAGRIAGGDMVLLKPNIVDPEPPGSGEVTDVRVIKALIKIIDEVDPGNIEIVVGEGAPRPMDYEMDYQFKFSSPQWDELWDAAGYQDLLTDPYLDDINLLFSNLNGSPESNPWEDLVLVDVPGGGDAVPQGGQYYIHEDVLNADFFITVPVMKIHTPGITVALKNQIGIAPSTRYGFSKTAGVPQDNYAHQLVHDDPPRYWTDKEIVDLCAIADIDFAVVDAIACLELQKSADYDGGEISNLIRMNTVVASPDPVAADHIATRLMGLNPDDIEHITLAERHGLGTNDPSLITVVGESIENTQYWFKKNSAATADFGQSNRTWLMKGPYDATDIDNPIDHAFMDAEATLAPLAGSDGWSQPVYFTEDRLALDDYFDYPDDAIGYAFTYFTAADSQEAELWLGSDEAMKIWLNGEVVYDYDSYRNFPDYQFISEKIPVQVNAGDNRLLVKTYQDYGRYHFTLNICEPQTNPYFDGNRIWGLKFTTQPTATDIADEGPYVIPESFSVGNAYPNPFNGAVTVPYELEQPGRLSIRIYDIRGNLVNTLFDGDAATIGEKSIRWNGTNLAGNQVGSGMYYIRFVASDHTAITRKMIYLK